MSIEKISSQVHLACGHRFAIDTMIPASEAYQIAVPDTIGTMMALQAFQLKQWVAEHTPEVCADTRVEQQPTQTGGTLEVGGETDQSDRA